jgi:hypothetical protein
MNSHIGQSAGVLFPTGERLFSSSQRPDRLWGPSNPLFSGDRRVNSPEIQRPGREGNHSSLSNAEVKNGGAIPPGVNLPYFTLGAKILHILSHV